MTFQLYQPKLHMVMEKLSNGEQVAIDDEWIEAAGEMFKAALRKQLKPEPRTFVLRMSNIGKPLCQLQLEKAGMKKSRLPYNHVMKMLLGDATECIIEVLLRAAEFNITGGKSKVTLKVAGTEINGEDDIEIDGKVFDTKSSSPWAFHQKWDSWETLKSDDSFGYIPQMIGYSHGQGKKAGGWIVVNKSTGEVRILEIDPTDADVKAVLERIADTVTKINSDAPFEPCFKAEKEKFRTKPTGNTKVPLTCTYCSFMSHCWPNAQYKPQAGSQAQNPKYVWYDKYIEPKKEENEAA